MKKSITLALGIAAVLGMSRAHALSLYCVHDQGLKHSQFCTGAPFGNMNRTPGIVALGPLHRNCDIEALDVRMNSSDPVNEKGTLYAASGDDTPRPGHLYWVNKSLGTMIDLGDVDGDGGQELLEIDAISLHPATGEIWGWAQGEGLFVIDPNLVPHTGDDPSLYLPETLDCADPTTTSTNIITAKMEIATSTPEEIEDIEWNFGGTIIYGVENVHDDGVDSHGDSEALWPAGQRDYDEGGIKLWALFKDQDKAQEVCTNLMPTITAALGNGAEIEGLESLPRNFFAPTIYPSTKDLLVLTFHGPSVMRYAVIEKPIDGNPPQTPCTLVVMGEIPVPGTLNDIEGLAVGPTAPPDGSWDGGYVGEGFDQEAEDLAWQDWLDLSKQEANE